MKTGRARREARRKNRPGTAIGWAFSVQKDLSSVFASSYAGAGEPSKRIRRRIRAGHLVARNEGLLSMLFGQSAAADSLRGTQSPPSGRADEAGDRSARQMSEVAGFHPAMNYDMETGDLSA